MGTQSMNGVGIQVIRAATKEDFDTLFGFFKQHDSTTGHNFGPDKKWFNYALFGGLFHPCMSCVFVSEDKNGKLNGMIFGFLYRHTNSGVPMALAGLWYVIPEKRKSGISQQLLRDFESWAKGCGARYMVVGKPYKEISLSGPMAGYRSLEMMFMKEL